VPNRNHSLPALLLAHVLHGLGLAVHPIVASFSRFSDLYGDTFNSSKLAADSWPSIKKEAELWVMHADMELLRLGFTTSASGVKRLN